MKIFLVLPEYPVFFTVFILTIFAQRTRHANKPHYCILWLLINSAIKIFCIYFYQEKRRYLNYIDLYTYIKRKNATLCI